MGHFNNMLMIDENIWGDRYQEVQECLQAKKYRYTNSHQNAASQLNYVFVCKIVLDFFLI